MNTKVATGLGTIILIIVALTALYFVKKADDINSKNDQASTTNIVVPNKNKPTDKDSKPLVSPVEGVLQAINGTEIVVNNNTGNLIHLAINGRTPVTKIVKGKPEVRAGLPDVKPGAKVKVYFSSNQNTKQVTTKIVLIEE